MNGEDWDLDNLIRILTLEIEAREACNTNQVDSVKELSVHNRKVRGITTESLHVGNRVLRCVFCKQDHYADKCNVVTDVNARLEIIRSNKLCFKCLSGTHGIGNCRSKQKCY